MAYEVLLRRLFHAIDWFPTLYSAAGGDASNLGEIDGVDQWPSMSTEGPSARSEMLYNIDTTANDASAIRIDDMKLVAGDVGDDSWYPDPDTRNAATFYLRRDVR